MYPKKKKVYFLMSYRPLKKIKTKILTLAPGHCLRTDLRASCSTSANHKPEHEVHQLKPLPPEEAVAVGRQHEAGAESVEQVLHHLLLLRRGRVVPLEHLTHSDML